MKKLFEHGNIPFFVLNDTGCMAKYDTFLTENACSKKNNTFFGEKECIVISGGLS